MPFVLVDFLELLLQSPCDGGFGFSEVFPLITVRLDIRKEVGLLKRFATRLLATT